MNYLTAIDYTCETASVDFIKSLRETGFGVIKNHPIDPKEVNTIYEQWYDFFSK